MGQDESQVGAPVAGEQKSPEEIRAEIEDTRSELGDTAAALAAKTDVKARARDKLDGVKQTLADKKESLGSSGGAAGTGDGPGIGAQAGTATSQLQAKAKANPIPTAAIAAFVGGFLFGRITKH
jgi:hypothetical protein